jgi:succinate dehydrogenase / fumarate reductase membrane anchor subunit
VSIYVLEGLRPWVIQRVSAVYIALFIFYLLYCSFSAQSTGFDAWHGWLFQPLNSVGMALFVLAILFHTWIGMRDVVLDYIHPIMLRILVLALIAGTLVGSGLWAFRALLLPVTG